MPDGITEVSLSDELFDATRPKGVPKSLCCGTPLQKTLRLQGLS